MNKKILHIVPYPSYVEWTDGIYRPAGELRTLEPSAENGSKNGIDSESKISGLKITENLGEIRGNREAYDLDITRDGIVMTGAEEGLFYAHITLEQLKLQFPEELPCLHIEDCPRFAYRGFMIDSCRHFLTESDVMTLIDAASYYKLNKMHWHLTDDQGWRIEIEKYPRLTEVGAQTGGDTNYAKFYSKKQIRRILKFAKDRNIEIIPEIEIPGHSTAAIAAYPELGCTGEAVPVAEESGIYPNLICAGREECFQFLTDILDEVCDLFPSKTIHIGGDEAKKDHWKNCPYCQTKMKELSLPDEEALQRWYTDRIIHYLNSRGRSARVWSDAFTGNDFTAEDYSAQFWEGGSGNVKYQAALGHKLVNSDTAAFYLDYPYRGEVKMTWGHPTNLDTILNYDPYPKWLGKKFASAMIGVEATLWTELVPDLKTAVERLFPRLPAVAEVAWTSENARDNASFDERYEGTAAEFPKRRLSGAAPKEYWH